MWRQFVVSMKLKFSKGLSFKVPFAQIMQLGLSGLAAGIFCQRFTPQYAHVPSSL
jgi:hypothetical protein